MIKWTDKIGPTVLGRVRFDTDMFGIELEYEHMEHNYPIMTWWTCEHDPSLRNNGVEFVSSPLAIDEIPNALDEVGTSVLKYDLDPSWRCGLHTHMNVTHWSWRELVQHAVLYALVEPYIFANFAPGREANHFCVPFSVNTRLVDNISSDSVLLRAGRATKQTLTMLTCNKYSALNYKPIAQHGTIEFRHMPSTADMAKVQEWCDMLYQLAVLAREYDSPEQIVTEYEDMGIFGMLEKLGLHTCDIDPDDTEDAYIAAALCVGHDPVRWQDLNWNFPIQGHDADMAIIDELADLPEEAFAQARPGQFINVNFAEIERRELQRLEMDRIQAILEGDE